jgi:hypothetical protein
MRREPPYLVARPMRRLEIPKLVGATLGGGYDVVRVVGPALAAPIADTPIASDARRP